VIRSFLILSFSLRLRRRRRVLHSLPGPPRASIVADRVLPRIATALPSPPSRMTSRLVATRRGGPQVRRAITAPATRRGCYGDPIDRVRASGSPCIIQYDKLYVALRPPGRYAAVATAAAAAAAATAARNGRGKKGGC